MPRPFAASARRTTNGALRMRIVTPALSHTESQNARLGAEDSHRQPPGRVIRAARCRDPMRDRGPVRSTKSLSRGAVRTAVDRRLVRRGAIDETALHCSGGGRRAPAAIRRAARERVGRADLCYRAFATTGPSARAAKPAFRTSAKSVVARRGRRHRRRFVSVDSRFQRAHRCSPISGVWIGIDGDDVLQRRYVFPLIR